MNLELGDMFCSKECKNSDPYLLVLKRYNRCNDIFCKICKQVHDRRRDGFCKGGYCFI